MIAIFLFLGKGAIPTPRKRRPIKKKPLSQAKTSDFAPFERVKQSWLENYSEVWSAFCGKKEMLKNKTCE